MIIHNSAMQEYKYSKFMRVAAGDIYSISFYDLNFNIEIPKGCTVGHSSQKANYWNVLLIGFTDTIQIDEKDFINSKNCLFIAQSQESFRLEIGMWHTLGGMKPFSCRCSSSCNLSANTIDALLNIMSSEEKYSDDFWKSYNGNKEMDQTKIDNIKNYVEFEESQGNIIHQEVQK